MSTRTFAGLITRLIGLHMGAWTLQILGSMLGFVLPPFKNALDMSSRLTWANIPGVLVGFAIAAVLIGYGDRIAGAIFAEEPLPILDVSAGDLLRIGVCLVGLIQAAHAVPVVLQTVGSALWYAGATRQAQFGPALGGMWAQALEGMLSFAAGVLLMVFARPLAAWLSPKAAAPADE